MSVVRMPYSLVLIFSSLFLLISCSENKIKNEQLILECKGKRTYKGSSSNWVKDKVSTYEVSEVYEFNNFFTTNRGKEWSFSNTKGIHLNSESNNYIGSQKYTNFTNISVVDREIFVIISRSTDFDTDEKIKPQDNQKNDVSREILINRISGIWEEKDINKTIWKDGSTLTMNYYTIGRCEKGEKKF